MAITTIRINEWELRDDGKVIPLIHFDPVTVQGKLYGQLHCFSYRWLMERGLGVNAVIFLGIRSPGRTAFVKHLNKPTIPNIPPFCACGKLLQVVGRHLQCLEPEKKCLRRGIHAWLNDQPLDWFNASLVYSPGEWSYFRDTPNFFEPRKVSSS